MDSSTQRVSDITIGAVSFCSNDWAKLLVDSIRKNSSELHEIILVDNSPEGPMQLPDMEGITILRQSSNISHGSGLDVAIREAKTKYFLALDIDAHVLAPGWEDACRAKLDEKTKILGARGGDLKPYRPCVSFFDREYFVSNGHSFEHVPVSSPHGGYMTIDVGVFFALRTLHDGFAISPLEVGAPFYTGEDGKNCTFGDTYTLDGKPFFYHHWYGTRFANGEDSIDGIAKADILASKANLFEKIYGTRK